MKCFSKTDINVLDFMVKTSIDKGSVNADDLIKEGFIKYDNSSSDNSDSRAVDEFVSYLHVLDKYNVCECFFNSDSEFGRKNEMTFHFKKRGGFKVLYDNLKLQDKKDKLEHKKNKIDIELAERTLKEFKRTKFLAWSGFVIGFILLIKELLELKNS